MDLKLDQGDNKRLSEHIFEPLDPVEGADRLFMFRGQILGQDFGRGGSESSIKH